jgi:Tol biopolymer transport system component
MLRVFSAFILSIVVSLAAAASGNAQFNGFSLLQRVSVGTNGTQGNGDSIAPSMSADGRYVAFISNATNLDPADNNANTNLYHVYVYDRDQHILKHISSTSDATQQWNYDDRAPSISADGRYVAFTSTPGDAGPGDPRGDNVFVYDLVTDTAQRIAGPSQTPSISGDGRYVSFLLNAGSSGHLFIYDRSLNTTERVSVATNGIPGNDSDLGFSMSSDGRYFAFVSNSLNLDPNSNTNNIPGVFVRDRTLGTTTLISKVAEAWASISADGRYVAYSAFINGHGVGFIYDRSTNIGTKFSDSVVNGAGLSVRPGRY